MDWPKNEGCLDNPTDITLKVGEKIDRFGDEKGFYFAPEGLEYTKRSMNHECNHPDLIYHVYQVIKEFKVLGCEVSSHFGEDGGGYQYWSDIPMFELINQGYIKEVIPTPNRPC
jgi:filamentous hemagglutinin